MEHIVPPVAPRRYLVSVMFSRIALVRAFLAVFIVMPPLPCPRSALAKIQYLSALLRVGSWCIEQRWATACAKVALPPGGETGGHEPGRECRGVLPEVHGKAKGRGRGSRRNTIRGAVAGHAHPSDGPRWARGRGRGRWGDLQTRVPFGTASGSQGGTLTLSETCHAHRRGVPREKLCESASPVAAQSTDAAPPTHPPAARPRSPGTHQTGPYQGCPERKNKASLTYA